MFFLGYLKTDTEAIQNWEICEVGAKYKFGVMNIENQKEIGIRLIFPEFLFPELCGRKHGAEA